MAQKFITTEYDMRGAFSREYGYTIALVSDLHEMDPSEVLVRLREAKPDVIMVAGDTLERHGKGCNPRLNQEGSFAEDLKLSIVGTVKTIVYMLVGNSKGESENSYRFLREASKVAPIYMSLGNHEWYLTDEDMAVINETGTVLLDNADTEWNGIHVGGVSSIAEGEWLEKFRKLDGDKIMISHHPEVYDDFGFKDFNLVLAGHAHGGQWRLGGRGLFASRQGVMPKYCHGVYDNMVVGAGCSNTSTIPRVGNPCELVLIRV